MMTNLKMFISILCFFCLLFWGIVEGLPYIDSIFNNGMHAAFFLTGLTCVSLVLLIYFMSRFKEAGLDTLTSFLKGEVVYPKFVDDFTYPKFKGEYNNTGIEITLEPSGRRKPRVLVVSMNTAETAALRIRRNGLLDFLNLNIGWNTVKTEDEAFNGEFSVLAKPWTDVLKYFNVQNRINDIRMLFAKKYDSLDLSDGRITAKKSRYSVDADLSATGLTDTLNILSRLAG